MRSTHEKCALFLYTNNEQAKKEIKKATASQIASKTIKYVGINLTKERQDSPLKITERCWKKLDLNKWKDIWH